MRVSRGFVGIMLTGIATAIATPVARAQDSADSLEVTIVLLPENATGPEEVIRRIELPLTQPNQSGDRENGQSQSAPPEAVETGGEGLDVAADARERGEDFGKQIAEQARENRENFGREDEGEDPGPPPGIELPPTGPPDGVPGGPPGGPPGAPPGGRPPGGEGE